MLAAALEAEVDAVTNNMGAAELARKYLESPAGSDLLAEMVKMAAEALMGTPRSTCCAALAMASARRIA